MHILLHFDGAVSHMATHAIVLAQLIIGEQNHGIHPFIVQIRSLDDHRPFPGDVSIVAISLLRHNPVSSARKVS